MHPGGNFQSRPSPYRLRHRLDTALPIFPKSRELELSMHTLVAMERKAVSCIQSLLPQAFRLMRSRTGVPTTVFSQPNSLDLT